MRRLLFVLFVCFASLSVFGQTSAPKFQPGTVLEVQHHHDPSSPDNKPTQYDVTVQIGDTVYVVLYTPPYGSNTVEYRVGHDGLFALGNNVLILPGTREQQEGLPILSTRILPAKPAIDWSKGQSQYFSMKMKNLSTSLSLSEEQEVKIKPIAEQESAEAGGVIFTPVVSRKERLSQWEKIVRKSDAKMRPILSEAQWQKLQDIRKDQKRELTELIAKQDGK
jgi:hypothetical protein